MDFMQVRLDKLVSTNCKAGHWFEQDKQYCALGLTSPKYFQSAAARTDGILFPNLHKALLVGSNALATQSLQRMTTNKIDNFNLKAEILFRLVLEKYGYILEEKKVNEINGQKWSTHHIYTNNKAKLKIVIKQEPYYTDYGFSFFIHKLGTDKYNILYNVPHEKQDKEDKFLNKAYDDLFTNQELIDIISGKTWKELRHIPFQT